MLTYLLHDREFLSTLLNCCFVVLVGLRILHWLRSHRTVEPECVPGDSKGRTVVEDFQRGFTVTELAIEGSDRTLIFVEDEFDTRKGGEQCLNLRGKTTL